MNERTYWTYGKRHDITAALKEYQSSGMVAGIRELRRITGCGLKEAKDYFDALKEGRSPKEITHWTGRSPDECHVRCAAVAARRFDGEWIMVVEPVIKSSAVKTDELAFREAGKRLAAEWGLQVNRAFITFIPVPGNPVVLATSEGPQP